MAFRKQRVFLYLTGGLGNQLFQFAALKALAFHSEKYVLANFGHPRRNSANRPELFSILDNEASLYTIKFWNPRLAEKVIGFNLRLTVGKSSFFKIVFRFGIQIMSNVVISILAKRFLRIIFKVHAKPNRLFRNSIMVGYFQVADYAPTLSGLTRELQSIGNSELKELIVKSSSNPLVIHLRRGDYLAEKDFGVLHQNYYMEAYRRFSASDDFKNCKAIWVFSDDIEHARQVIHLDTDLECEWISEIGGSASLTMLAMSLGSSFIIANSTFSWWAAQLSRSGLNVYFPQNWFKNIHVDKRMFPQHWVPIANGFEDVTENSGN